jgi:hypothetical protein
VPAGGADQQRRGRQAHIAGPRRVEHRTRSAAEQWTDLTATGCPRCGGWTWLASTDVHDLIPTPRTAEENPDVYTALTEAVFRTAKQVTALNPGGQLDLASSSTCVFGARNATGRPFASGASPPASRRHRSCSRA